MTTKTKVQRRAICPACFADQAVRGVRMVDHGYTLPYRYSGREGHCFGVDQPHFGTPEGRKVAEAAARGVREDERRLRKAAAEIRAGGGTCYRSEYVPGTGKSREVVVENPTAYERESNAHQLDHYASLADGTAKRIEARVAAWKPEEPREVPAGGEPRPLGPQDCPGSRQPFTDAASLGRGYRPCPVCRAYVRARPGVALARVHRIAKKPPGRWCMKCGLEKTKDTDWNGAHYRCPKGKDKWSTHVWRSEKPA